MGPYGSVGDHIKTGRSPMAQYHFQTPPDSQKNGGSLKKRFGGSGSNRLICRTTMLFTRFGDLAAIHPWWGYWYYTLTWVQ